MKDTTLLIMAAGLGSRFGEGIKQLAKVDDNNHIIMDYSIHDALEAGFNKVVFVIRKDLEKDFKEIIGDRISKLCKVEYAYQQLDSLPSTLKFNENRVKPYGTGHAVLVAKPFINEPFLVINADDYYGKNAFKLMHDFLIENYENENKYGMVGYVLKNTMSENGAVSRGIIETDKNGYLTNVNETKGITKTPNGAGIKTAEGEMVEIDENSQVSMNMWALTPEFMKVLETGFVDFYNNLDFQDVKSEYLLPLIVDSMIKNGKATVKVLPTNDTWFGVTYQEDKQSVYDSFKKLIETGVYTKNLY